MTATAVRRWSMPKPPYTPAAIELHCTALKIKAIATMMQKEKSVPAQRAPSPRSM